MRLKRRFKLTEFEKKIFVFLTIFGFASVFLKLFNIIDYSWILVTLPFWLSPAFVIVVFTLAIVAGLVVLSIKTLFK